MIFERPTEYIEKGLITEKEHDIEPYVIYNYTPATHLFYTLQ